MSVFWTDCGQENVSLNLLPDEPSISEWADEARQRFEIVKTPPLLALLEEAVAVRATA